MGRKQNYIYNQSVKNYEVFDDFSGGMDTINADALIRDNVSRDIVNFDVKSGGVLAKRRGLHSVGFSTDLIGDNSNGKLTQAQFDALTTEKSFKFKDGSETIIVLYTKYETPGDATKINHLFINITYSSSGAISTTNHIEQVPKLDTVVQPPIINMNGDKAYLMFRFQTGGENGPIETKLLYWFAHNWEEVRSSAPSSFDQTIRGPSSYGVSERLLLWPKNFSYRTIALQNGVINVDTQKVITRKLPTKTNKPEWPSEPAYLSRYGTLVPDGAGGITSLDSVYSLIAGGQIPRARLFFGTSANIAAAPNSPGLFPNYDTSKFIYDFTKFEITISYIDLATYRIDATSKDITKAHYDKLLQGEVTIDLLNSGTWEPGLVPLDFITSNMITNKFTTEIIAYNGSLTTVSFDLYIYDHTGKLVFQQFIGDCYLTALETPGPLGPGTYQTIISDATFSVSGTTKSVLLTSFDSISKPNPKTYTLLGYNLLNILKEANLDSIDAAKLPNYINISTVSENTTLLDPIITNKLLPTVGDELNIIVPTSFKTGESKADYYIGYRFMPLEQWVALETGISTNTEFIDRVVKPAVWLAKGVNEFKLTPPTSSEYVLLVYSTKKDPTTLVGDDVASLLSVRYNLNPTDTVRNNFDYHEIKGDFSKVKYSLNYKNQWIVYGGSNKLFVSDVNNFGYFPLLNVIQIPFSEEITNVSPFFDSLIVQTATSQYLVKGDTPSNFQLLPLNSGIGAVAHKSVKPNINYLTHLTEDGVYNTKAAYSFDDRANLAKIDSQLVAAEFKGILSDPDASAVVHNNRYIIHTPSTGEIWKFYNNFNSWVRDLHRVEDASGNKFNMELENMYVVNNKIVYVNKGSLDILEMANRNTTNPYTDIIGKNKGVVISQYSSKELSVGLPDHEKKWKALHVKFEDTPLSNDLYAEVYVDGMLRSTATKEVTTTSKSNFKIESVSVQDSQITTITQGAWDKSNWGSPNGNNSKFDADNNQLHKIQLGGRGKAMNFTISHIQDQEINITNVSVVYKIKKPKPTRKR